MTFLNTGFAVIPDEKRQLLNIKLSAREYSFNILTTIQRMSPSFKGPGQGKSSEAGFGCKETFLRSAGIGIARWASRISTVEGCTNPKERS
jgi:hypothetical protein